MKSALLVIDVQNYYINKHTQDIPKKIENFIGKSDFDFVLFTQFVNHKSSNVYKVFQWGKMMSSPDIDISDNLIRFTNKNNVFQKDTYSTFKSKVFRSFIEKNNIEKFMLCGFDTDACIMATAYEGFDLGYSITVLDELTKSHSGNDYSKSALRIINKNIQKNQG